MCADLWTFTAYFQYRGNYHRLCNGFPSFPESSQPIHGVIEKKALKTSRPQNTVQICEQHLAKNHNINDADCLKFTHDNVKGNSLTLYDCVGHKEEDGSLNMEVYRKPTHTTDTYFSNQTPSRTSAECYQTTEQTKNRPGKERTMPKHHPPYFAVVLVKLKRIFGRVSGKESVVHLCRKRQRSLIQG